jgi:hypothetical protein
VAPSCYDSTSCELPHERVPAAPFDWATLPIGGTPGSDGSSIYVHHTISLVLGGAVEGLDGDVVSSICTALARSATVGRSRRGDQNVRSWRKGADDC